MKKVKISIVEDQPMFRKGLISLLEEYDEIKIISDASNGAEFISQLETIVPDVVLLDLQMPEMDGYETTKYLKKNYPEIKIVILTSHNEEGIIKRLIDMGAHGFLLKDNEVSVVIDAVDAVLKNGYYFNEEVSQNLVKGLITTKKINPEYEQVHLSERETEVLKLICKELTNREITEKLFLSERTVDTHRINILKKTNAKNIIGAVIYALRNNLIDK